MRRHLRGALPARRSRVPEYPGWHPRDDVAAIKGCVSAFGVLGVAAGLGLLVTWLLVWAG